MRNEKKRIDMKKMLVALKALLCATVVILQSSLFMSCKEEDNTVEEFPDWKNKNEAYFQQVYDEASVKVLGNPWKAIRSWSLPDDLDESSLTAADHIVVNMLKNGGSTSPSPLYSDTVVISYRGRLLPSTSYAEGMIFEDHLGDNSDPSTYTFLKMGVSQTLKVSSTGGTTVSSNINGFTTVLQHMHVGDFWRVYIPWQLGYGEEASASIPAYSTLVFDIYLKAYYHPGNPVPDIQGKTGMLWPTD